MKGGRTGHSTESHRSNALPQWSPPMKGGRTVAAAVMTAPGAGAAMELAYERRGEPRRRPPAFFLRSCRWSPPMKGGRTCTAITSGAKPVEPQWSPPMKGGRTRRSCGCPWGEVGAAMEPAYERRENQRGRARDE